MLQVVFLLVAAVSLAQADQCGVPAVTPKDSKLQGIIAHLTGRSSDGRIVGGVETTPHSFPWQVAMLYQAGDSLADCGGSIINNQFILTAGHCCVDGSGKKPRPLSGMNIRVGAHNLRSTTESFAKTYRVTRATLHPKYNDDTLENDFCLLKLAQPLTFSAHVSPICLADASDDVVGQKCIVTGWGSTKQWNWDEEPNPTAVSRLRQAEETIISQGACNKIYDNGITSDMICAYTQAKSSCQGDSGGPFVCQSALGAPFKLVGVVSWGFGCSDKLYPASVYARTSSALDWIAKVVAAN